MKHIRHTLSSIAALLTALAGLFVAGPVAFAAHVSPGDGGSTVPVLGGSGGMPGWEITLIALGAAFAAAVVTAALMRLRLRAVRPATV